MDEFKIRETITSDYTSDILQLNTTDVNNDAISILCSFTTTGATSAEIELLGGNAIDNMIVLETQEIDSTVKHIPFLLNIPCRFYQIKITMNSATSIITLIDSFATNSNWRKT